MSVVSPLQTLNPSLNATGAAARFRPFSVQLGPRNLNGVEP